VAPNGEPCISEAEPNTEHGQGTKHPEE